MRVTRKSVITLMPLIVGLAFSSCKKEGDEEEDEDSSTTTVSGGGGGDSGGDDTEYTTGVFPIIALNIPVTGEETAALNLQEEEIADTDDTGRTYTILDRYTQRAEHSVANANQLMSLLNRDQQLPETGTFFGKGPEASISGEIKAIEEGVYTKEAVLCVGGAPFVHIRWNADGTNVEMTRDFENSPGASLGTAMKVKMIYVAAADKSLELFAHGKPWAVPPMVDGEILVDYGMVREAADGVVTVSAVEDWKTEEDPVETLGDSYIVGRLNADATGEFVGYRKVDGAVCGTALDEANTDAPGWCHGRSVGGERYTDEERDAAWERLKDIGVPTAASLVLVDFDDSAVCPTEE